MTRLLLALALIATAALLRRRHPATVAQSEPVDAYVPMAAWLPIPNLLGVLT